MSVSVEKTSSLGRRLTIEVPAANVKVQEQEQIKDLAKNLRIEGFRRGKVPANFIMQKYGEQIHQEAVSKVIQQSLSDALKDQNLRPADRPNVEDLKADKGDDVKYTVSFEVYPDIELKDFSNVVLEKEVAEITEADIQSGIKKLQAQFATWSDVSDRPAQDGDRLTIDFVGLLNGEPFDRGSANDQIIEIGSNTFIPGFEEGLIGITVGGEKTLDLTFPESYGAKELAGKAVQFKVTVKKMQGRTDMPVNADFAAKIGIEDKDPAKVAAKVRENMEKYVADITSTRLREQALEKLFEVNQIDIPAALIANEKHNLIHERMRKAHDDHDHDLTPEQDVEYTKDAKKRVAVGLLLNEIISKNNLKPEEERILAKINAMAVMYGGRPEMIQKMYQDSKELRQSIQNMVLTDQAADLVVANATIKEKPATFDGIVGQE